LNEEGEISSGEHCFISDHEIVKKKFCLDHQGRWNPIGEWQLDKVMNKKKKKILFFIFPRQQNKFEAIKNIFVWKQMVLI
jgi:hypothetical protein